MIQTLPAPAVTGNAVLQTAPDSAKIVTEKVVHKCDVDGCGTTVFEVKHGMLIIERTHHGERHTTIVSIAELFKQYVSAPSGVITLPMMDFYGGTG